ncbi:MAG TPA: type II toxin-antitoxin system VapC family toxin [Saprospiraceae bacterium]|mgnify:CR=1 FL=1|nr:type II toxin-antitoxin system VapC family toxin [Saprospiraceae bacterium]
MPFLNSALYEMNGRFLLDTNAVIALLQGHPNLLLLLKNATWVGIPIIVEIEFLSFPDLSKADIELFKKFKNRIEVVSLESSNSVYLEQIIQVRKNFKLKLPDAIIAATATLYDATLFSNDSIFQKLPNFDLEQF